MDNLCERRVRRLGDPRRVVIFAPAPFRAKDRENMFRKRIRVGRRETALYSRRSMRCEWEDLQTWNSLLAPSSHS